MATFNNIFALKIDSGASGSGSLNFGNGVSIGSEFTYKAVGGASFIGDYNGNRQLDMNKAIDPDIFDQVR